MIYVQYIYCYMAFFGEPLLFNALFFLFYCYAASSSWCGPAGVLFVLIFAPMGASTNYERDFPLL